MDCEKYRENKTFRAQIQEDIKLIQEKFSRNKNISKEEYAFNYWVLIHMYSLDGEVCDLNITEYNDKGIDCFVHYKEDKELYIIQNKYYRADTRLNSKDVSDFLMRPIATLKKGNYKNTELQEIYNEAKEDEEYKIFLHFYVTNTLKNEDVTNLMRQCEDSNVVSAEIFYLDDITNKYYGKQYKEQVSFDHTISIDSSAECLSVNPNKSAFRNMTNAFYLVTNLKQVYQLFADAEEKAYPLFEENIREYLGMKGINKGIIDTLKDPEERKNFFYYNNGITIICDKAEKKKSNKISMKNPQIVNGCQTVNSIVEAVKNKKDLEQDLINAHVMVKILQVEKKDKGFYRDIVKYTNSQNSINEKAFAATLQPFFKIQENLEKHGFLLLVKQSDKYQFEQKKYTDKKKYGELLEKANDKSKEFLHFDKLCDVEIPLETLLQIIGAFTKDAQFAFMNKAKLLKRSGKIYRDFSFKINEDFTVTCMIMLLLLYKKAEYDRKKSEDKRYPIPYYFLNFLGFYLQKEEINKQDFLKKLSIEQLNLVYEDFKEFSKEYYDAYKKADENEESVDYSKMCRSKVDETIMQKVIDTHFEGKKKHNPKEYNEIMAVFTST